MFYILIFFLVFSLQSNAAENPPLSEVFISQAIQGDLRPFNMKLEDLDRSELTRADQLLIEQFEQRFVKQNEAFAPQAGSEFMSRLLSTYRHYWTMSLMGERSPEDSAGWLNEQLVLLLTEYRGAAETKSIADPQDEFGSAIAAEGFHYLMDEAPPLQDLFLWKSQETREYSVRLTDQTRTVTVNFMDDFELLGWKYFASLGLASTTGWVQDGELYCVVWAYDRNSERFRVSYLQHEARHLADYELFPGLDSINLEYRAKLTELAYAFSTAHRILEDFTAKSAPNPSSPHAMANYRLTRALYLELFGRDFHESSDTWKNVSSERINRAARNLLEDNTGNLLHRQEKAQTPDFEGPGSQISETRLF
jgi:hypothetical protein